MGYIWYTLDNTSKNCYIERLTTVMNFLDPLTIRIPRKYLLISIAFLAVLAILVVVKIIVWQPAIIEPNAIVQETPKVILDLSVEEQKNNIVFPFTVSSSTLLTDQEYTEVKKYLVDLVKNETSTASLVILQILMDQYPSVSRSCHGLVHDIGHETYAKHNDFAAAMAYRDDICGSGFLHGVIESHFAKVDNVFEEMDTICNAYTTLNEKAKCYHGVGHGIMFYTENDLPGSITYCDRYPEQEARVRCAEGIFMENFNTEQKDHVSEYLDEQNPASICETQKSIYKGTCYFYAPLHYLSLYTDAYTEALVWCTTLDKEFQAVCASGVGSRAIKQHITSPHFVEKVCLSGTKAQFKSCLDGMVSYYLVHVDSLSKAKEMCLTLDQSSQQACEWSVLYREDFFPI